MATYVANPVERLFLHATLNDLHSIRGFTALIHGAARGADALAEYWAFLENIPIERYPANWHSYGKPAGPMRNEQMLREAKPDLVVGFKGGTGTRHMIDIARRAYVEVITPGWEY